MAVQVTSPPFPSWRALLVIAALICLCISSNVGPQFFPLPAAKNRVALNVQVDQAKKTSYEPQADAKSFRVPMMAQSKKRADKEPPQADPLIALPLDRFDFPSDTSFAIETDYPICFSASVTMAPSAGRAPPSLV